MRVFDWMKFNPSSLLLSDSFDKVTQAYKTTKRRLKSLLTTHGTNGRDVNKEKYLQVYFILGELKDVYSNCAEIEVIVDAWEHGDALPWGTDRKLRSLKTLLRSLVSPGKRGYQKVIHKMKNGRYDPKITSLRR